MMLVIKYYTEELDSLNNRIEQCEEELAEFDSEEHRALLEILKIDRDLIKRKLNYVIETTQQSTTKLRELQ